MTSGSTGSHRAFMGVCITLCFILVLTLYVGWTLYFNNTANRNTRIAKDQTAEQKAQDLEKLGITFQTAHTDAPASSVLPKLMAGAADIRPPTTTPPAPAPPPSPATLADSPSQPASLYPVESSVKELPMLETSDEVIQAMELLDQYWKTADWKERVPLVAHSERVAPLMRDYYGTQGASDPEPGALVSKARYQINGTEILYFSYASSRPTGSLEIAMLRGPQGKFLIDWESLTGYGEMSFQEFRTKRPHEPVLMRAYVRLFEYYNHEFSDSEKYLCIKLTSESGDNSVYAYCERGTPLAQWIERDLATTGPAGFKGYTMLISFPPNAQSNQCVNLDKVMAQRWLKLP
ncbi:hypothetical protein [Prosthecobacter sp.]|uniref:hypothetical protein n=1 Tax=Prosthecobacter sp. TaxID=1965333 RepID=UPI002489F3D0|nr:hypothetical protein [Prosthecobacter sp.]MDI1314316.1 hypothetical protein [Prosthecobacter sp.]